ncbi:MAG: hypothetical protein CML95_06320 [Rhodobiaceae bacterium]|nr:hypothetical protein [Rhodobiaceae bacterium]
MADEESEIRRMAEIADAINAILDADPVGDTPAQGAKIKQEARDDGAALPVSAAEVAAEATTKNTTMNSTTDTPEENLLPDDLTDDLDAAIAAELGQDSGEVEEEPFGPAPDIDFGTSAPINNEIGREVRADSQLADLTLRMQDTLAEIRTGNIIHGANNQEMLAQMTAARDSVVAAMREQVEQLNQETAERKVAISEHLQQLESQNTLLRDEMEIKILKFEDDLKQIQQKYFENAVTDSDRLDRYREFLKYLLTERGTNII